MTIKTDWLPGDVFTSGDLNDLTVEVQSKLDASDAGGVDTDMLADDAVTSAKVSAAIRTSLGKADSAVQPADLSSAIADLSGVAVNAQTANYTLVLADASKAVEVTSASSTTEKTSKRALSTTAPMTSLMDKAGPAVSSCNFSSSCAAAPAPWKSSTGAVRRPLPWPLTPASRRRKESCATMKRRCCRTTRWPSGCLARS